MVFYCCDKIRKKNLKKYAPSFFYRINFLNYTPKLTTKFYPEKLPGELWVVTPYFNPMNYKTRKQNYNKFRKALAEQNVRLLTVELTYKNSLPEISDQDADKVIRRNTKDILWHKENLINIGIQNLPKQCDKVAWLDCDVLFSNKNWAEQACQLLEKVKIIQPFDSVARLPQGENNISSFEGLLRPSAAKLLTTKMVILNFNSLTYGHGGYGWVARRQSISKTLLYPYYILGGFDRLQIESFFLKSSPHFHKVLSPHLIKGGDTWKKQFQKEMKKSISFIPGTIFHLWHGTSKGRKYRKRQLILKKLDFNPEKDLIFENDILTFTNNKPALKIACEEYFRERKEDD